MSHHKGIQITLTSFWASVLVYVSGNLIKIILQWYLWSWGFKGLICYNYLNYHNVIQGGGGGVMCWAVQFIKMLWNHDMTKWNIQIVETAIWR